MPFAIDYAARSHVGMVRSDNQDSGYAGPHLLAMADGMGGHAGGDIASSIVIGALVDLDDEALSSAEAGTALLARIKSANAELADRSHAEPALRGMGTTLIAILRSRNRLVLAHIGDSRAFLARDGQVTQITKDHSFVQTLVDEGRISAAEAASHPQRALVTRVLTGRPDDEPDLVVREARPGDRYLIASDGLTDYVAADTIEEILTGHERPGPTADRLVELALRAGAPDNVTVIIGDIIDLTRTTPPATAPQIVGSAAMRRKRSGAGTRPIPLTPAEKAAALRDETGPAYDEPDDELTLAEETGRTRGIRRVRALAVAVVALVLLAAGSYAAYAWSQQQLYVSDYHGNVTVYQGVRASLGPVDLSHPEAISEVKVADLPAFYVERLKDGVDRPDQSSAAALVETLRVEAAACRASRDQGKECATTVGAIDEVTPTQTPTPTTSTSGGAGSTSATGTSTTTAAVGAPRSPATIGFIS